MSKKNKKPTPSNLINTNQLPKNKTESSVTQSIPFWQNTKRQAVLIFVLAFGLYANTLTNDFCQDDAIVITDNMFTTAGVSGFGGILSEDTFYGFFKEAGKSALVAGGRYRPFTLLMFAAEYQVFGKNPFVGHFINVLLFGLTCVLLYFLLIKLLNLRKNVQNTEGSENINSSSILSIQLAFITAILFAAHPIHTEAVANIKGRDEIMTLLGSLAAVWFSLKNFEKPSLKYLALIFTTFFIALLSKENAITFVVLVPLIYWFFVSSNVSTALKQTIPFVAASVGFLLLRGVVIGNQFGTEQLELMNNPFLKLVGNQYVPFDFSEKAATILFTLGKYIQLLVFPHPLTHDYYPRHIGIMSFSDLPVILSGLVYVALIAIMAIGWQKRSLVSFGIAYFLITLSIVSNIVFPVGTNMAERFLFMPSVGFCLIVAVILLKILPERLNILRGGIDALPLKIMLVVVISLFGLKIFTRNFDWKDNFTIFTTDVLVSENSAKLQNSVGGETIEHFKTLPDSSARNAKMREAITHLQRAIAIHPTYKSPFMLLGNAYFYLNEFEKSIANYEIALQLDPNFKDAKNNLALVYREGGKIIGQQQNNLPKAILFLNKAVEINPNDDAALSFLGTAYGIAGQPPKCIEMLSRALALRFDVNDARNISVAYRQTGDIAKAVEWENKASNKQ